MATNESIISADVILTTTAFSKQPVRTFTIRLKNAVKKPRNTSKSLVWDYFGDLYCNEVHCDRGRNYCNLCLEKAKDDAAPNTTFESFNIRKYQTNVSTSNYAWHLCSHHGITEVSRPARPRKNKLDETAAKMVRKTRSYKRRLQQNNNDGGVAIAVQAVETPASAAEIELIAAAATAGGDGAITVVIEKQPTAAELTNAIAVWFARDMIPFGASNGAGFQDFIRRFNSDAGFATTTSQLQCNVVDIHTVLMGHVRDALSKAAIACGCLTVTRWGDVAGHFSYTNFTYHFLAEDFGFEHMCLRVVTSLSPLSADNLSQEMQLSVHQFGVEKKKLFVTRDNSDALVEASCQELGVRSVVCIGHVLDGLVVTEGINVIVELRDLLIKSHLVVSTLNLGAESLMTAIPEPFSHEALLELGLLEDMLMAEELFDTRRRHTATTPNEAQTSARWHVNMKLLQTLIKHKTIINVLLEQLQNVSEVGFDEDEWQALESLHDFVVSFVDAVDILSDNYPTQNLVLLFRSHLLLHLEETKNDHPYVVQLKALMKTTFDERFPIEYEAVLAALLDPRLRDLMVVNDYLATVKKDKAQFLSSAIWKHEIVVENATTMTVTAAVASSSETVLQLNNNSNVKRQRLSITALAKQHSGVAIEKSDAIGDEVNGLLAQTPESVLNDDILSFWNRKQDDWPILSALARIVYCIPATTVPVSLLFQHDGLLRASRFCSLNPAIADKVVFVGENFQYFEKGPTT